MQSSTGLERSVGRAVRACVRIAALSCAVLVAGCGELPARESFEERDATTADGVATAAAPLLLDQADSAPIASYSVALKLRADYAGYAMRVRRASDSAHAEIGFTGVNRVDVGAIATFCGASDCFIAVLYDQSGQAQDLAQGTVADQIKIYTGSSRTVVGSGAVPAISVTTPGKTVVRGGLLGLSGNPAFTIAYVGRHFTNPGDPVREVVPIRIFGEASATNGNQIGLGFGPSPDNAWSIVGAGSFGWATAGTTETHRGVLRHEAGAPMDASTFRFNGVELGRPTQGSNASGPFDLRPNGFTMLGKNSSNNNAAGAEISSVLIWNTVLNEHDLALVDQLLDPSTFAASSAVCYGAPGTQALAPFPMVGLCPMHRGQSPAVGAQSNATRWIVQNGSGAGRGAAVIAADGTIFAPSTGRLTALNPANGATLWSVSARSPGASPAIGSDGTVYSISSFNSLEARNPSNGTLKWSFGLGSIASTGPAIGRDGTIYVTSQNGRVSALTPAGAAKWTVTRGAITTSPAIGADGTIYVGADNGLHAINPDGTARWTASFGTGAFVRSSPAIAPEGTIYVGTDTSRLVAVNPDGTTRWTFVAGGIVRGSPSIAADGTIYFGSRDRNVYAVRPNGTLKWTRGTGANVDSTAAIGADGLIYIGSDSGRVYALRPADGTVQFSVNGGDAFRSPITIGRDGTVYAGDEGARLFAVGPAPACAGNDTSCDSRDQDCDGTIDEDYVSQVASCGVGACARVGATACVDGAVRGGCVAGAPAASDATCNATDENCSGQNDEGYVSSATSCGAGECTRAGASSCVAGAVQSNCTPAAPATSFDATCDGRDDNCNSVVDDSCGVNLLVNGTFETGVAPNVGRKVQNGEVLDAPELVQWETTDTQGTAGALRVELVTNPADPYYTHSAGPMLAFSSPVPEGVWLRVSFRAKSLSGGTLLQTMKTWGGSTGARTRITSSWASYEVYTFTGQATSALVFNVVANDSDQLQHVVDGVFLLDDVEAHVVPPCTSATSCGNYSPDALFGSSLIEEWTGRALVTLDEAARVSAWRGTERGLTLTSANPNRPVYGQDADLNYSHAVLAQRAAPSVISATFGEDLIASGTRPYIAIVHRLRAPLTQPGSVSRILELRARTDGTGPVLGLTTERDAGGNYTTKATYAPEASAGLVHASAGPVEPTVSGVLTEIWLAPDGLHHAQNGVERPVAAAASAALAAGLRYVSVGNDLSGTQGSDASVAQVVILSGMPTPAQRAAYHAYVQRTFRRQACASCHSGDACCPVGCTSGNDSDCQTGDLCAGIASCIGGDGCCPSGCETSGDGDCPPVGLCTIDNPCGNGEPGCMDDDDCEAGLSCGLGIGPRFGQPADVGVCWNPTECATLNPDAADCGTPSSLCGEVCCLPSCSAPGQPDGCGGTCAACVAGVDTDGDGRSDCDEDGDGDAWTDRFVFNGVTAFIGNSCHAAPTCSDIDTTGEVAECFAMSEQRALHSGWDFATSDTDACQSGFGFSEPWQACGPDFGMRYVAAIRLPQNGTHCFRIDGSTQNQCGALFFDGEAVSTSGTTACVQRESGVYPISWFYETTDDSGSELHVRYCTSASGACTPTELLPASMLRREQDAGDRLCAPDAPCSALCPCSSGRACDPNAPYCASGLDCRAGFGDRFGLSAATPVCWAAACDDLRSDVFACGTAGSLCGLCPSCTAQCDGKTCGSDSCFGLCAGRLCQTGEAACTTDSDCSPGLVCGIANGTRFGRGANVNVCWAPTCESADPSEIECGTTGSPCGLCQCQASCDGRECGDDGCGGSCGTCITGTSCNGEAGICIGLSPAAGFADDYMLSSAPVGTLPGTLDVSTLGDAVYTIPLEVPPGRGGIEPQLALQYDSGRGNGYLGIGWALEGLSTITRCNFTIAQDGIAMPPFFNGTDDAFCLDGQRLIISEVDDVPNTSGPQTIFYRTENDRFARVQTTVNRVAVPGPDGGTVGYIVSPPTLFTVHAKDGRIFEYEGLPDFRSIPGAPGGVAAQPEFHVFPLSRVYDRTGANEMRIEYTVQHGANKQRVTREYYPRALHYGPSESPIVISFFYTFDDEIPTERPDRISIWRNGIDVQVNHLLRRIAVFVDNEPLRNYHLDYTLPNAVTRVKHSQLREVSDCVQDYPAGVCKPPTRFEYGRADNPGGTLSFAAELADASRPHHEYSRVLDMNGDGLDDLLFLDDLVSAEDDCFFGGNTVRRSFRLWESVRSADRTNESKTVGHRVSAGSLLNTVIDDCEFSGFEPRATRFATRGFVDDWDNDGDDDFVSRRSFENGTEGELVVISYQPEGDTLRRTPTGIQMRDVDASHRLDVNGDNFQDLVTCSEVNNQRSWHVFLHSVTPGTPAYRAQDRKQIVGLAMACDRALYPLDVEGDGTDELVVRGNPSQPFPPSWNPLRGVPNTILHIEAHTDPALMQPRFVETNLRIGTSGQGTGSILGIDLDGDDEFSGAPMLPEPTTPASPRVVKRSRVLLDVNGDGLRDVLDQMPTGARLQLNRGDGFFDIRHLELDEIPSYDIVWDVDLDGREDLFSYNKLTGAPSVLSWNGTDMVPGPSNIIAAENLDGNIAHPMLFDGDGDGLQGLVVVHFSNSVVVADDFQIFERSGEPRERIHSIRNGLGAVNTLVYEPLTSLRVYDPAGPADPDVEPCTYPFLCREPRRHVLWKNYAWDEPPGTGGASVPPARAFKYEYARARMDALGRGPLGFAARAIRDQDPLTLQDKRVTEIEYDNEFRDPQTNAYPLAGLPERQVFTALDGERRYVTAIDRTYEVLHLAHNEPGAQTYAAVLDSMNAAWSSTDEDGGAQDVLGSEMWRALGRDEFANVTSEQTIWDGDDSLIVEQSFAHESASAYRDAWLIGLPTDRWETYSRASDPSIQKVRHTRRGYYAQTGLLASVIVEPDDPAQRLDTYFYRMDAASNITGIASAALNGGTQTYAIDYDAIREYPISIRNSKNQVTSVRYERMFGNKVRETDPNTLATEWYRDGFGRVGEMIEPGSRQTSITYSRVNDFLPFAIETRGSDGSRAREELDVLARLRTRRAWGMEGQELIQSRGYDADGNLDYLTVPTDATITPPAAKVFAYDTLGRMISSYDADGETEYGCHDVRTSCFENARGNTRCEVKDARGRIVATREPIAMSCEDALALTSAPGTTHAYGAFGLLRTVIDASGNVTRAEYDGWGRRTLLDDPDLGARGTSYDAYGRPIGTTDPLGRIAELHYDVLGRLERRVDTVGGTSSETRWIWDGGDDGADLAAGELIGYLTESRSPDNVVRRYEVDPGSGLPRATVDVIDGESFRTAVTRDSQYRIARIDYPSAQALSFAVTHGYDDYGNLIAVRDAAQPPEAPPLWRVLETSATGQISSELTANLMVTQRFHDALGRTRTITTAPLLGTSFQATRYWYDGNDNVRQRDDEVNGRIETFAYDAQERILSESRSTGGGAVYTYDGANLKLNPQTAYTDAHPHAITFDGTNTYQYDAAGNRFRREGGGALVQRTSYTPFDKPREVWNEAAGGARSNVVSYLYDAEQQRVRKDTSGWSAPGQPAQRTIYAGDLYERRTPAEGGAVAHVYYVMNAERVVAQVTLRAGSPSEVLYLHDDDLGSTRFVTTATGAVTELDYDAFGVPRRPDWMADAPANTTGVSVGFTGHEHDEHGLVNMRGRIYDLATRQFTTPDPFALNAATSASLNRYSYVRNNPLSYVDPSGYDDVPVSEPPMYGATATIPPPQAVDTERPPSLNPDSGFPAFNAMDIPTWSTPAGDTLGLQAPPGEALMNGNGAAGPMYALPANSDVAVAAQVQGQGPSMGVLEDASTMFYTDRATGKQRMYPWINANAVNDDWGHWITHAVLNVLPFLPGGAVVPTGPGIATVTNTAPAVAPKLLAAVKIQRHHLLPQKFRQFFSARGIDIDKLTVELSRGQHLQGVHGRGDLLTPGGWNKVWAEFIEANPSATAKQIYQQLGKMMDDYGLSGAPIVPYR